MPKKLSITLALAFAFALILCACSNSEYTDYANGSDYTIITANDDEVIESNNSNTDLLSSSSIKEYLPLDDTEYPYAGIPRIVIETAKHQAIKDRETEIPAKLQIWGEKEPESEIMDLTIRGRGNTSWGMPKKNYKIEFVEKQPILGMPKDRDWALIANYADKTLIRNHLIYQLSKNLGAPYSPQDRFVEFFLNGKYYGVYQLSETIKVGKNRVSTSSSFLIEFDKDPSNSEIIFTSQTKKIFNIHYPKNVTDSQIHYISSFIDNFEKYLNYKDTISYSQWIIPENYIQHYWLQEFSNNTDGDFNRSVFFTITEDDKISMGPVWDFDLSFGNHFANAIKSFSNWRIRDSYWNKSLFSDTSFSAEVWRYWTKNRIFFQSTLDSIEKYEQLLSKASENNFKRWPILKDSSDWWKPKAYSSYNNAIKDLKDWITNRIAWIDKQIQH